MMWSSRISNSKATDDIVLGIDRRIFSDVSAVGQARNLSREVGIAEKRY